MGLHRLCVRPVSYTHLDVYKRQFKENPDGQFELGAAAYEKRGTAVTVPTWNAEKCIQCNQCAFVCSHATIRPFMLSEDEVKAAPSNIKLADTKPKASEYKYTMSVSPLDCMGSVSYTHLRQAEESGGRTAPDGGAVQHVRRGHR